MAANETDKKNITCYKLREGPGSAVMLDVRLLNGDRYSFPYNLLIWTKLDRAEGLFIRFSSHTVLLKGRGLLTIHEGILQQRVEFVQEELEGHDVGSEDTPFISSIKVFEAEEEKETR